MRDDVAAGASNDGALNTGPRYIVEVPDALRPGETERPTLSSPARPARALDPSHESSAISLFEVNGRRVALIADEDARAVRVVDVGHGREYSAWSSSCPPGQLLPIGTDQVAVSLPRCGQVAVLAFGSSKQLIEAERLDVGQEPTAMATSLDGSQLYVVDTWGQRLFRINTRRWKWDKVTKLGQDPRAVSASAKHIVVSYASGGRLTVISRDTGERLTAEAHATRQVLPRLRHMPFKQGHVRQAPFAQGILGFGDVLFDEHVRTRRHLRHRALSAPPVLQDFKAIQAFSISRRGSEFLIPETLTNPGEPTAIPVGYGTMTDTFPRVVQDIAVLSPVVDGSKVAGAGDPTDLTSSRWGQRLNVRTDWALSPSNRCFLPRASRYDGQRDSLFVACLGRNQVVEFSASGDDPARQELRSWQVPAGPVALALDPAQRQAIVYSSFARRVSVLSLGSEPPSQASPQRVRPRRRAGARHTEPSQVLRSFSLEVASPHSADYLLGRALFHTVGDTRLSRDGRSCASCHPAGRHDGLVWRTSGELPSRQTPMLAGRVADTAPYSWTGRFGTLEEHIAHTIDKNLNGIGATPRQLRALAVYISELEGPAPRRRGLSRLELRGKRIFQREDAGCTQCHLAGGKVDGVSYDFADALRPGVTTGRDTPSLRHLAGTAPFFHDGRYETLDAMLVASAEHMGQAIPLDAQERRALAAYLRTL